MRNMGTKSLTILRDGSHFLNAKVWVSLVLDGRRYGDDNLRFWVSVRIQIERERKRKREKEAKRVTDKLV